LTNFFFAKLKFDQLIMNIVFLLFWAGQQMKSIIHL